MLNALSPEEEAILSQQADPDAKSEPQYQWDEEYQRFILGMLVNDRNFLVQTQGLIKPQYFTNDIHKLVSKILFEYFEKYKQRPTRVSLQQEVEDHIREQSPPVKVRYRQELHTVFDNYIPGIEQRDYLRDKIVAFAKEQEVLKAFYDSIEILKKREDPTRFSKVYSRLEIAMRVDRKFEIGENYFEDYEARYLRVMEAKATGDVFTSGLSLIDNGLGGGMLRGEIGAWTGVSGTGKSLMLTNAAIGNLKLGKYVLYISLEMNQDRTAERFDAQLADPAQLHGVGINNLYQNKEVVFAGLKDFIKDKEDQRLLIIKQFPSRAMDVPTFRAYFAQCQLHGFQPDLVIIDYVGEMKDYPGMATWESRQRMVGDLRGFAVEEKVCVLTALQPDKKAKEAVRQGLLIEDDNLADSYGQIRPLDAFWSINITAEEKDAGIARVKVVKHRSGESGYIIYLNFDKQQLKFTEISRDEYERRKKEVKLHRDLTAQDSVLEKMYGKGSKKKKQQVVEDPANVPGTQEKYEVPASPTQTTEDNQSMPYPGSDG